MWRVQGRMGKGGHPCWCRAGSKGTEGRLWSSTGSLQTVSDVYLFVCVFMFKGDMFTFKFFELRMGSKNFMITKMIS